jgi:hypothetical protein
VERDNAFSRRVDSYVIVLTIVSYTDHCKLRLHVSRFEFEMKVSPPDLEINRHMQTWSVMVNAAVVLTSYSKMASISLLIAETAKFCRSVF